MNIEIRKLKNGDCGLISESFAKQDWNKSKSQYESYLVDQKSDLRLVLIAFINGDFAGYLTIKWKSDYPPFQEENIPEINDLNVLIKFRNKGIATALMNKAESIVAEKNSRIGIGVGLTADYGNAQVLYVKRGYVPDGNGISYNEKFLIYGDSTLVDDDLILCLVKDLNKT